MLNESQKISNNKIQFKKKIKNKLIYIFILLVFIVFLFNSNNSNNNQNNVKFVENNDSYKTINYGKNNDLDKIYSKRNNNLDNNLNNNQNNIKFVENNDSYEIIDDGKNNDYDKKNIKEDHNSNNLTLNNLTTNSIEYVFSYLLFSYDRELKLIRLNEFKKLKSSLIDKICIINYDSTMDIQILKDLSEGKLNTFFYNKNKNYLNKFFSSYFNNQESYRYITFTYPYDEENYQDSAIELSYKLLKQNGNHKELASVLLNKKIIKVHKKWIMIIIDIMTNICCICYSSTTENLGVYFFEAMNNLDYIKYVDPNEDKFSHIKKNNELIVIKKQLKKGDIIYLQPYHNGPVNISRVYNSYQNINQQILKFNENK